MMLPLPGNSLQQNSQKQEKTKADGDEHGFTMIERILDLSKNK